MSSRRQKKRKARNKARPSKARRTEQEAEAGEAVATEKVPEEAAELEAGETEDEDDGEVTTEYLRDRMAELVDMVKLPQRAGQSSMDGLEGSALALREMSVFRNLSVLESAIMGLANQKAQEEPELYGQMSTGEIVHHFSDEEVTDLAERSADLVREERDANELPSTWFYRGPGNSMIDPSFWPKTNCRLVDRLMQQRERMKEEGRSPAKDLSDTNGIFTMARLLDRSTKRIIVDHDQFAAFNDAAHGEIPEDLFHDLHWPFDDDIYMEFSEPFAGEDDDGTEIVLEGLIVTGEGTVRTAGFATFETDAYVLRAMDMDIQTGREVLGPGYQEDEPDVILPRAICMTMAYMTARNMKLVPEPLPRNVRRRLERKQQPNPWYVVAADDPSPRYPARPDGQPGSRHGYRYDVIGHFRVRQYELPDGTMRSKRSWVRAHQRGLRHTRYIPATRRFKKGEAGNHGRE